MVDHFTKFGSAILMKNKTESILSAFKQWLTVYLKSKILHTGNCGLK